MLQLWRVAVFCSNTHRPEEANVAELREPWMRQFLEESCPQDQGAENWKMGACYLRAWVPVHLCRIRNSCCCWCPRFCADACLCCSVFGWVAATLQRVVVADYFQTNELQQQLDPKEVLLWILPVLCWCMLLMRVCVAVCSSELLRRCSVW